MLTSSLPVLSYLPSWQPKLREEEQLSILVDFRAEIGLCHDISDLVFMFERLESDTNAECLSDVYSLCSILRYPVVLGVILFHESYNKRGARIKVYTSHSNANNNADARSSIQHYQLSHRLLSTGLPGVCFVSVPRKA